MVLGGVFEFLDVDLLLCHQMRKAANNWRQMLKAFGDANAEQA
jgi:hypothetical protein